MTVTLITGATRGIGREVARRLADEGHTVYLGARDLSRGTAAAAGTALIPIALEVTDPTSIAAAVERLRTEAGGLDVLVNNAGIAGEQRPPAEATIEDLRRVLDTNVVGAAAVLSAFTPLLEASDAPVVVNVSSAVGSLTVNSRPDAGWSMLAYPMSKAALNMLTVQYAKAFPRWRVNSATPGLTATEFVAPQPGAPTVEELRARGVRINTVEQGAEVVVRMATAGPDGPTGTFVGNDGPVPW